MAERHISGGSGLIRQQVGFSHQNFQSVLVRSSVKVFFKKRVKAEERWNSTSVNRTKKIQSKEINVRLLSFFERSGTNKPCLCDSRKRIGMVAH